MCFFSVIKVVIVDIKYLSFSYERAGDYGSQDSKSRKTSKLNDRFKIYDDLNATLATDFFYQSSVDNGGVTRGRSVAVGVSGRWKVTCDT